MRSLQVVMFTLCLVGGLYLLMQAPSFFMPDRWSPATGLQFNPAASRLLGAGLLAVAGLGVIYLQAMYYSAERRLPGTRTQWVYFALVLLAIALISVAMQVAETAPNPDYRPPRSTTAAQAS
jgi:hypothetical protein